MSLVYDALQKAAQENKRVTGQPAQPVLPPASPALLPVATRRSPALWITGLSLVAFTLVVGGAIIVVRKPAAPVGPATAAQPVASVAPVAAIPPAPVAAALLPADTTANDPRFKLTGIMRLGAEYSAVINGHVVAREQYVDGAIVKSVERDRVTLNIDGREIVVRLF